MFGLILAATLNLNIGVAEAAEQHWPEVDWCRQVKAQNLHAIITAEPQITVPLECREVYVE